MFPVSDFSFVYCGMATVAATMGYVYAKRRRVEPYSHSLALGDTASPNDDTVFVMESPAVYSKSDNEIHLSNSSEEIDTQSITVDTTTTVPAAWSLEPIISIPNPPVVRGPSLKRKQMHDHDENNIPLEYPYNLAALYPNKRCKTPPSSQTIEPTIPLPEESTQRSNETVTNPEPTPEILTEPVGDSLEQPASKRQRHGNEELEYSQAQRDDKTPLITTQLHSSTDLESECTPQVPPTTANDAFSSKPSVATLDPTPPTPPRFGSEKFVPKTEKNALAFESYLPAASSSRAAKATPVSQTFAFEMFATATPALFNNETLASGANMRPVWSTTNSFRKRHSFVDNPDDVTGSSDSGEAHALGLASRRDSPSYTHVTGEEDEDVQSELRGVKLFVKRGSNDYSSGILGQVKYLSDKKTLVQRLLFRREPLRKVSMNIRLQPAVRCTFDPQECILRLLLAESSESKASGTTEIVVYALKPGRFCSRKDFQTFSESVMGNSGLKTVATSSTGDEGSKEGSREVQS